jgi:hypothetical protein
VQRATVTSVDEKAREFLSRWHAVVRSRDLEGLRDLLANDVRLGAPPYWDKLEGKDLIHHLLGVIVTTIDGFTYHREWVSGSELALEFRGRVGEFELQGVDLITLDDEGRVRNLDALIRPLNTLTLLRDRVAPRMQAYLEGLSRRKT